jgi:hypothetical protein
MRRSENSQASSKIATDTLVIQKNSRLTIPAAHHMVNLTRVFQPLWPRQGGIIAEISKCVNMWD